MNEWMEVKGRELLSLCGQTRFMLFSSDGVQVGWLEYEKRIIPGIGEVPWAVKIPLETGFMPKQYASNGAAL